MAFKAFLTIFRGFRSGFLDDFVYNFYGFLDNFVYIFYSFFDNFVYNFYGFLDDFLWLCWQFFYSFFLFCFLCSTNFAPHYKSLITFFRGCGGVCKSLS